MTTHLCDPCLLFTEESDTYSVLCRQLNEKKTYLCAICVLAQLSLASIEVVNVQGFSRIVPNPYLLKQFMIFIL